MTEPAPGEHPEPGHAEAGGAGEAIQIERHDAAEREQQQDATEQQEDDE